MMYNPAHPGEILKNLFLDEKGITIQKLADHLNITRTSLSRVVNAHASISTELALKLEKAGISTAQAWLAMQANYNLWQAKDKKEILAVKPLPFGQENTLIDIHPAV